MYLVVVGWLYVVVMMVVAEATNPNGSLLGAIVTFFFYGLIPVALVVYLMGSPYRRRLRKARETAKQAAEHPEWAAIPTERRTRTESNPPDASGHAPTAAQADRIAAVRKEP